MSNIKRILSYSYKIVKYIYFLCTNCKDSRLCQLLYLPYCDLLQRMDSLDKALVFVLLISAILWRGAEVAGQSVQYASNELV